MSADPLVATALVRRVVIRLVAQGLDRDALLAEAGVPPASLGLTRLRVRWAVLEDVLEAAERLTGDDRIGFHAATRYDVDAPSIPELLFFASGTLGDAIRRIARVARLWSDVEQGWLLTDPPRARYAVRTAARRAHVHLHEHILAIGVQVVRQTTGVDAVPVEVRFVHHREGDLAEFEDYFGCPVRFGAGASEVVLRPEQLELSLTTSNPIFARHFERQAEAELAALTTSGATLGERLRQLLKEDLDALRLAESSLEGSAARLRTSPRTLQRGLGLEGTTFARELDAVRRGAAEQMLLAGMDIAEASWRLGYAEPPVFHRAFKRWTGDTPERFRQRAAGGRT